MNTSDAFWSSDKAPAVFKNGVVLRNTLLLASAESILPNANILIRGGNVDQIYTQRDEGLIPKGLAEIDASGFIITPGLLNAHTHAPLSYLRGYGHGQSDMIENLFFKTEKNLSAELLEPLSYSYIYDGLRSGVTFFGDHYYYIEGVAKALNRFGVRGMVGETICDLGGAFPDGKRWLMAKKAIENWQHGSKVTPLVAPHAADTVSFELLKELASYAQNNKLPLHMHLSQTQGEYDRVKSRAGLSPVAYAAKAGALSPSSLVVHLVSASTDDLKVIKDSGATVGYCPASQIIYEKLSPFKQFVEMNIPLALATDCAGSNDGADLWSEQKTAALLARHLGCKEEQSNPKKIFEMVTTNPAKVFGIDKKIGSIAKGKAADLVFIKRDLLTDPTDRLLTNLIYGVGARNVEHVMVDGQWVLWKKSPTFISESTMHADFMNAREEIFRRIDKDA